MATTFTKILIHFVFSTKRREPTIFPTVEKGLYAYMVGTIRNFDCWTLAINGTSDHLHLLVSMSKKVTIVDLMENVKKESSKWIKTQGREFAGFAWQEGYAGLSVGQSGVEALTRYIDRQKEHHRRMTFKEKLITLLKKHHIEYDERYIWT
jgi:REP element-mobilizing transposase RayT